MVRDETQTTTLFLAEHLSQHIIKKEYKKAYEIVIAIESKLG